MLVPNECRANDAAELLRVIDRANDDERTADMANLVAKYTDGSRRETADRIIYHVR